MVRSLGLVEEEALRMQLILHIESEEKVIKHGH